MNLVEQKKRVERFLARSPNDEPFTSLWARQREYSWKKPAFLKVLMQTANKLLLEELNDKRSLDKSFRLINSRVKILPESLSHLRRPRFCSIKDFFDKNPDTFLRFPKDLATFRSFIKRLSLLKSEPSGKGPPKGFVPLPDAEIGGCARNDSLIAPAI